MICDISPSHPPLQAGGAVSADDEGWATGGTGRRHGFPAVATFSAVAELGGLGTASDRLRVAQPALSRQIKPLEHELRAGPLVRKGRGTILTSARSGLPGAHPGEVDATWNRI